MSRPARQTAPVIAPRRRQTMWVVFLLLSLVVIPLMAFLAVEWGLRLAGYGYPTSFYARQNVDGKDSFIANPQFSWRFFPQPMARTAAPLVIPAEKPARVRRVFVLGSSAAQGDPAPAFSFSRILEVMLRERYPDEKIEVYNSAATAINSNVMLPIARDTLALQPDLFIVYAGNNEVIGPYGLSGVLSPFLSSRSAIKAHVWLGQTKIGQWLQTVAAKKNPEETAWRGMELFLAHQVRRTDPDLETIYAHFAGNLDEICRLASAAKVKVILSTVLVNDQDCAPFLSLHRPGLSEPALTQWKSLFAAGQTNEAASQWAQAIQNYTAAANIDGEYAELMFRLGRCQLQLRQPNEARISLAQARDCDALRFRADTRINLAIQQVAQKQADHEVLLVDADRQIRASLANGIPGASLLYEHVHLNFAGNYQLAAAMLSSVETALGLKSQRPLPSEETCRQRLAFTAFSEYRIQQDLLGRLEGAPFTNQCTSTDDLAQGSKKLSQMTAGLDAAATALDAAYRAALAASPDDWRLRNLYLDYLRYAGRFAEAHQQAQAVYKAIPFEYFSLVNLGITLGELKQFADAERYLREAIAVNPYFMRAYEEMALLYEAQRKYDLAESYHRQSRSTPAQMAAFYNRMGLTYAKERQFDIADDCFRKALAVSPGFAEAEANLKKSQAMKAEGGRSAADPEVSTWFNQANQRLREAKLNEAIELYRKVVARDPAFTKARNNFAIALIKSSQFAEAEQQLEEVLRLDSTMLEAYPNLAILRSMRGEHAGAIELLQKAVALQPSAKLYRVLAEEYARVGNDAEAQKCREQAAQMAPQPASP